MDSKKYDIDIIEYYHAGIKKEQVNENIHILPYIKSSKKLKGKFQTFQLYIFPNLLVSKFIKKDYDLYVAFNYLVPTFLLPKGTKNIAWIHGSVFDLGKKTRWWRRKKQDIALNNVQTIVTISDITEKSVRELFPRHVKKIVKIYNGIDVEQVKERALDSIEINMESPSILFVGRLETGKDPVRLINVLKLVHIKGIKAHLYYLGIGEEENNIIVQAEKRNLLTYVHMLGYLPNPFPIMKQCDITCLLSKSEGFSMCLLESISLGKPFVSTNIGGAKELSNNQRCGKIIETDEQAALAICSLLNVDKRQIEYECLEAIKQFELDYYIKQIEDLFDKCFD